MAKKKTVEPVEVDVKTNDIETKVKELLEKRKESSAQVQMEIDKQILELTKD